jgi:hypothetical protein
VPEVKDYSSPADREQAREWWNELVVETQLLEAEMGMYPPKRSLSTGRRADHAALNAERVYKREAQRYLKLLLTGKVKGVNLTKSERRALGSRKEDHQAVAALTRHEAREAAYIKLLEQNNDVLFAQMAYSLLRKIAAQKRVQFSEEEQEVMDVVQLFLKESGLDGTRAKVISEAIGMSYE